jgi:Uma2 family endonuclease
MTVTHTALSIEEFLKLPEEEPPLEFEDGVVTQKVSPKARHSRLQFVLADRFIQVGEPTKLALAFPELRATFAGRSYVPDVSLIAWNRIPVDESGRIADDFFEPPDIAVEIVSPEQRVTALVRRCVWYADNGVRVALIVDPADESVLVFRAGQPPEALHGSDRIDLSDVLPGFELTVQELFASLRIR